MTVSFAGWNSTLHTRQSSTEIDKYKHTKKCCTPSWLYLQDYTEMHGQQNIKNKVWPFHVEGKIRLRAQLPVTLTIH